MRFSMTAVALAAALFGGAAGAHEFKAGALTIGHPYAIETAATAKSGVGYFSITNAGPEADRLVAIKADFPMVEVHSTETDAAGVTKMLPVEALEIPPGETVTLAPRGLHVMFVGLTAPWKEGDHIPATLVFEKAGAVPVVFNVQTRKAGEEDGMGGMDHGKMSH